MKIADVELTQLSVPGRPPVYPYQSGWRPNAIGGPRPLIVEVRTADGTSGWGETSASPPTASERQGVRDQLIGLLRGQDVFQLERLLEAMRAVRLLESVIAGVEMALWDLIGKGTGRPLCDLLGGRYRDQVPLAACLGIVPPAQAAATARQYVELGFSTLKMKAGRDPNHDLASVKAIREAVGDALEVRIDANQCYAPAAALRLCRKLEEYDLQYFEQPCRQDLLGELARLRLATRVPIALNESCRTPQHMLAIAQAQAADFALPDTPPAGGIMGVKKIAAIAEAAGIPLVMHCNHDLGVKTAAMVHIVASTPGFRHGNDSTYFSLADDICVEPLPVVKGSIAVPTAPGLGVEVDRAKLERYRER